MNAAVAAGENPVDVIVTGKPHTRLDGDLFASRAASMDALSQRAESFFDAVRHVADETGSRVAETWAAAPAAHVFATPAMIRRLDAMPDVVRVDRDSQGAVRVDPLPGADAGVANTGGRQMIQAEEIWALGYRGEGVRVSIIDTGIFPDHEAFRNADGSSRIVAWSDWIGAQPNPYDDNGHGTHLAATAAGSRLYDDPTHGFFTQEGVAPRAQIMGAKFLSAGGSGTFTNAINALQWSFDNGADVTSNSWGASCNSALAVIQTVRTLTDLGMLSVFSAGGAGPGAGTVGGPACGESALSVGAIDANRVIASFSGRGPCSDPDLGTPPRICPDVVAKGVTVTSAWPRPAAPSGYRTVSGTSMATPFVAGAAVLSEQMKRAITGSGWDTAARAEEAVFKQTALDLGPAGPDNSYGWGLPQLLNIHALLADQDVATIVDTFEITRPVVREGDTTTLTFGVVNAGGRVATGPFKATLTDPAGGVTVLRERTIGLGFLDGETLLHAFVAGSAHAPGTYTFRGTFDYTWTDPEGDVHEGHVDRSGTFVVRRIVIGASFDGFEPAALPLAPQNATLTVTNDGNEDATELVLTVRVPSQYIFAPGTNLDPTNPQTRYSVPAPDVVAGDDEQTTLVYLVGTLAAGESFSFTSTLLATIPGAYAIRALADYRDGAATPLSSEATFEQTVGLPAA